MPLITVLLPVYNAEEYLEEALLSLANQTLEDFEVLILEDGCIDKSESIALYFQEKDKRFRWIPRKENLGIIKTLNQGLKLANGQYIARMDADDISLPLKLEKQVQLMKAKPDIISCGTQIQCFDEDGDLGFYHLPTESDDIFAQWIYRPALVHATSLTKINVFEDLTYQENFLHAEDYHLWGEILLKGKVKNLNEVLYKVRIHHKSVSHQNNELQLENTKKIFAIWLSRMNIKPTDEELNLHRQAFVGNMEFSVSYLKKIDEWLQKLYVQNQKTKIFPEPNFTNLLQQIWAKHTLGYSSLGVSLWQIWKKSPLSKELLTNFQRFKFWVKCLMRR